MLVSSKKAAFAQSSIRYLFCFVLLALSACKNKENDVTLVARNFGNELIAEQSLNFTFSRKLVSDSVVGNFVNESLLKITPSISGRIKWISDHEFSFTPSERFAPNTAYTIELATAPLLRTNKQLSFSGNTVFKASTAGLIINNVAFHWQAMPTSPNKAVLKMQLDFNYKLNPAELIRFLKVTSNGTALSAKAASTSIGERLEFELDNVPESDDDVPALIKIESGLPIPFSQATTQTALSYESIIPSKSKVTITDVQTEHSGTIGTIMIYSSVELDETTLAKSISINPDIEFEISKTDYGCMLTSEHFEINSTYRLTISTALQSALGGSLKSNFEQELVFGKLNPSISFVSNKAMYLGSKGFRNVLVNITSIPKVKVLIYKVYENNMLQFLSKGINYDGYYDYEEDYYYDYQSYNIDDYGDLIYSQEVETKTLEKRNASRILHIDFEDKAKNISGVYVLQVQSADQQWVQSSKVMSISDIGLIVKESPQAVTVFANSISTAKSLSGVKVGLITSKNQPIKTITTNSDGVAIFNKPEGVFPDYKVGLITASMGSDYNFLKLNYSNRIEQARFDVGGKYINEQVYDAYIYGDRDLYRPGETMHLAAIVRDMIWQKPGEMPVRFRILMPNGREFKTLKKILDEQGACTADVPIPASAVTGTYQVELYSAAREPIGRKAISVEEFMPDKIAVKLDLNKRRYALGDSAIATATATNLFGPPAANRNYKTEFTIGNQLFQSKKFSRYSFGTSQFNRSFSFIERSGITNNQGQLREGFYLGNEYVNHGILRGRVFATVFDESGRPVNRESSFEVVTQPYLLGIDMADEYVSLDAPVTINFCAVNADDKPMNNAKATVTIIRKEWYSVMERYGNGYRYNSQYRDILQMKKDVVINSQMSLPFTPVYNGSYEVRISLPGSDNYVSNSFYAYSYGRTNNNSFEVDNEGNIDIETDKEKYNVGDKVKLLFKTPFAGKMIVTIEQDKVLQHYSINTDNKSATLDFTLTDEHLPNVYVNAILIRPQDDGSNPLVIASGVENIDVENASRKLDVRIQAATQSRSRTKQTVRVQTTPNTPVTIAVVDEGILQIKNYRSPNPYEYFYAQRGLGVTSYNIYPMLFSEVMSKRAASGGDDFDLAKRVNPITNKRVNLVALWSGMVQSNNSGVAEFSFDIPQYNGSLRIMAVSFRDQKFNGAEAFMKVADPVVINSGLPRFASPGDTILMPITLSNTTASAVAGKVSIAATGPFKVVDSPGEITIKPNSELQLKLRVYTQPMIGAGTITTTVYAGKETFKEEVNMTSRPATSLIVNSGSGTVAAGSKAEINLAGEFIESSTEARLIVSRSPLVSFGRSLDYLVRYPHGCVEQTTSAVFPQLYFSDLVRDMKTPGSATENNPNYNVMQAIMKLQSMQMGNGALAYWQGGAYESWYGSIYAAHFLIEARKAGFDVDQQVLNKLFNYMISMLREKRTETYYYNGNLQKEIAPREVTYSLYVLALTGKAQLSSMNYYKANLSELSLDARYLLASAYALAGNNAAYQQILPKTFSGEVAVAATGGSFYSYLRDEAIALNTLLEVDPANSQVNEMAKHISEQIKQQQYLNTQECAFSFIALGKIARKNKANAATATVYINGKPVGNCADKNAVVNIKDLTGKKVSITASGSGNVYYFFTSEGVNKSGTFKEEDKYMAVRKTFYNRSGTVISPTTLKQNDLVIVKISVVGTTRRNIENVVITDMLPAGFEIENPRLSSTAECAWIKNFYTPQHTDIRDDRINLYMDVNNYQKDFYYMVRCVTKGSFRMGPVSADAMYNGEYHSYHGGGKVVIE